MSKSASADAAHAARGGALQLFGVIVQLLMPVYHILAARLFGQTAFGTYQAGLVVLEFANRFGWVGGDKAMHRFIAGHRAAGEDDLARQAMGSILRLSAAVAAVLAVTLFVAADLVAGRMHKPELGAVFRIMAVEIVPATSLMLLVQSTMGAKVARVNFLVRGLGEPVCLIIATLAAYALIGGPRGLAAAHVAAYVTLFFAAALGVRAVFGKGWLTSSLRSKAHPALMRFSLPVLGSEVCNFVGQKADLFIVNLHVDVRSVAVYVAAEFLGRVAANIRYAFDGIAAPVLSEALHLHDRQRLGYNLALITRWVVTLTVPLATTLVALRADLLAVYGPGYLGGGALVCVWTLTHLLSGSLGLSYHVLLMSGRSRMHMLNQLAGALTTVGVSLFLVPRIGMMGGALGALSAVMLSLAATLIEVWIFERVHPFRWSLAKPVLAGAGALGAQLGLGSLVSGRVAHIALVLAGGLIAYAGLLLVLRPAREEREIAARLWARLSRRSAV
jgi:O-antigen/teichoic acid export membrane protein